jgi:hypothetical protein
MLLNDHASVTLSSLVYDPLKTTIGAALTVATSAELLIAIRLNSKPRNAYAPSIRLARDHSSGARASHVTSSPLRRINANGLAAFHKSATDQPGVAAFYVATTAQAGQLRRCSFSG